MSNNQPDVWTQIWNEVALLLSNHDKVICAAIIAFFASLLKSYLYGQTDTWKRVLAEAILCGLIAGTMRPVLVYFNLDPEWIVHVGAGVGLVGTSVIRRILLSLLEKRFGGKSENKS